MNRLTSGRAFDTPFWKGYGNVIKIRDELQKVSESIVEDGRYKIAERTIYDWLVATHDIIMAFCELEDIIFNISKTESVERLIG